MVNPGHAFNKTLQEAIRLHRLGNIDRAINSYYSLLDEHPVQPDLWHLLGVAAHQKDDNSLAVKLIKTAISIKNDVADYHNNLGMALRGLCQDAEAEQVFRDAIELNPMHTKALSNLASILRQKGKTSAALNYARKAVATNEADPEAYNNLGNAEKDAGLLEESVASYRRAIDLAPEFALAHWNLSLALLTTGHYEEGFSEMGWRWRWRNFPGKSRHFDQPQWNGNSFCGQTLFLYTEQGLGDIIHMLRFGLGPKSKGGRVVLEIPKALVSLAQESNIADRIVQSGNKLPYFDLQASLMDIPRICRLDERELFNSADYLSVPKNQMANWQNQLTQYSGLRVGLNWSGNPENPVEKFRQLPIDLIVNLKSISGVTWFSLQKGDRSAPPLPKFFPIIDTGKGNLENTSGLINALDLIITSDTAVAHLAGALGKRVWVLLHHSPDWKWGLGKTTPWYPSARLFRQTSPSDWDSVFAIVSAELSKMVA